MDATQPEAKMSCYDGDFPEMTRALMSNITDANGSLLQNSGTKKASTANKRLYCLETFGGQ